MAAVLYAAGVLSLTPVTAQVLLFDGSNPALLRKDPITGRLNALALAHVPNGQQLTITATAKDRNISIVYGGLSTTPARGGEVRNAVVTMNGGKVDSTVNGGYARNGSASDNTVHLNGGETGGLVGGDGLAVSGNVVNISNGLVQGNVHGAFGRGDAAGTVRVVRDNRVHIGAGTVTGHGFAGYSYDQVSRAEGNSMLVTGGVVGTAGAGTVLEGGHSQGSGNADNNTLTIQGGTLYSLIRTGHALERGSASGNTTNISGGQILNDVYAGHSGGGGRTDRNTINLSGGSVTGTLYGGSNPDSVGNTLNLIGYQGSVQSVKNVQNYGFILPATVKDGDTMLGIRGDAVDLKGTQVVVTGIEGGGALLVPGATVTLIDHTVNSEDTLSTPTVKKGAGVEYHFSRVDDPDKLQIHLDDVQVAPQTATLLDAEVAGMMLVNQGGDRIAALSRNLGQYIQGTQLFGDVSGSRSRYRDANIKLNSQLAVAGAASRVIDTQGSRLLGAFVEYGAANFNTDAPSADGSGKTQYTGLGLFGRYDHHNGVYIEGALRAGRASLNYANGGLCTVRGDCASFRLSVPYYSLQAGLGWAHPLSTRMQMDLYSRLVWSHLNGSTQMVAGDPYQFDAIDSYRWRNGVRLNYALNSAWTTFGGLAHEQEYAGQAKGKVYNLQLKTQSMRGASGIAEWGVHWAQVKPQGNHLSLDVALEGYSGMRRGVGGQVRVNYAF